MSADQQKSKPGDLPAVQVRADMINGCFDLKPGTIEFMEMARDEIAKTAQKLLAAAPASVDIGRLIAGIDALQAAKNLFCDAAIIGGELGKRKHAEE